MTIFTVGKYETGQGAGWAKGDWNGDGVFGSGDLVVAFQDGGYEQGRRVAVLAIPEPSTALLFGFSAAFAVSSNRRKRVIVGSVICVINGRMARHIISMSNSTNPYYAPPASDTRSSGTKRCKLRLAFFVVNLSVNALLVILSLVAILALVVDGLGELMVFPMFMSLALVAYGLCEWRVFWGSRASAERKLASTNLAFAALFLFLFIVQMLETPSSQELFGWMVFGGPIIAYLLGCGYFRLRWARESEQDTTPREIERATREKAAS